MSPDDKGRESHQSTAANEPRFYPTVEDAFVDDFVRYCCGDPDCPNDCEREESPAAWSYGRVPERPKGAAC